MKAIDVLMGEHEVILDVLLCLEALIQSAPKQTDWICAAEMVDFFQTFADQCHHGKEENHFFKMLETKGFTREQGPVAVMMREHEEGRGLIRDMKKYIQSKDWSAFAVESKKYLVFLRSHIERENNCLFPMADQLLGQDDNKKIVAGFNKSEITDMKEGTHEKYLAWVKKMKKSFDLSPQNSFSDHAAGHAKCGCHH